jgi:predicted MFS family arabinose efflux permease
VTHGPRPDRQLILALLCLASFASVFNNLIIAPILPDISEDLGVKIAVAGLLVTVYALFGGAAAIFAGPFIDRLGRKPIVVTGLALLSVATFLSAIAPTFETLIAARALAGLGVACLSPAVFSAVGDYFSYEERGRAMAWVMAANSSASIFGVPAGAFLSGVLSWRMTFVVLAALCVVFTFLLALRLPGDRPPADAKREGAGAILTVLRDSQISLALLSNAMSTMYWFVFIPYMGAFYHDEFGLPKWALGMISMAQGLGVLTGSAIGGRLSDRFGKRPIIVWGTFAGAVFILLETVASPHIAFAAVFLFLFANFGAARFASAQAVMTEMAPQRRGTVMALAAAGQQLGIVAGSAVGGLVLGLGGYTALGPVAAAIAVASALIYMLFVDESRLQRVPEGRTGSGVPQTVR